jgi:hypothetical protein
MQTILKDIWQKPMPRKSLKFVAQFENGKSVGLQFIPKKTILLILEGKTILFYFTQIANR